MVARQNERPSQPPRHPPVSSMFEDPNLPLNVDFDDQDPEFLNNRSIFSPTGNPPPHYGFRTYLS